MALHISRAVDLPPEAELRSSLMETQRQLTRCMTAIEVITKRRLVDSKSEFYVDPQKQIAEEAADDKDEVNE